jgi:hypothetical protein
LNAELTKPLDAKKAKTGDEVTAKVTQDVKANGRVVVRKGSKLVGHVTEAKARTKEDSESKLGMVFDRAILKDGQEVQLNAMVQALAPPATMAASAMTDDTAGLAPVGGMSAPSGRAGGGGLGGVAGGATSTVGSTAGAAVNNGGSIGGSATGVANGTVGGVGGVAGRGVLSSATQGVVGMPGMVLTSATSGNADASVLSSKTQNIRLDSGTQMVLQVQR